MAWVKIDDQAPRKGKMLKAGPAACWLWVCGIAHCQSQLTDGFISFDVLPMIGVAGVTRCRKLAEALVGAGLFERADGGYTVHDYLDHNPTRAAVIARRAEDAERKRIAESVKPPRGIQVESGGPRAGVPSHPIPSPVPTEPKRDARESPKASDETAERAGRFCERYGELYAQHRRGARYLPRPALDFQKACDLCAVWDDARLERLATVFLKTDHDFAASGSRTIGQFAALASWCDDRLREVEAGAAS